MRFHRECIRPDALYDFHGLVHRAGALFDESDFTGDENAIVDFKYSASPRITWWFDHHLSAFLTPADQQHFLLEQQSGDTRHFYDPDYTSCTSFIAHIAQTRFGFDPAPVAELVRWADIVDGALYESPKAAVEMAEPMDRLCSWWTPIARRRRLERGDSTSSSACIWIRARSSNRSSMKAGAISAIICTFPTCTAQIGRG